MRIRGASHPLAGIAPESRPRARACWPPLPVRGRRRVLHLALAFLVGLMGLAGCISLPETTSPPDDPPADGDDGNGVPAGARDEPQWADVVIVPEDTRVMHLNLTVFRTGETPADFEIRVFNPANASVAEERGEWAFDVDRVTVFLTFGAEAPEPGENVQQQFVHAYPDVNPDPGEWRYEVWTTGPVRVEAEVINITRGAS